MVEEERPVCTVIVCTRDRPEELERCVKALARLDFPRYCVLIVDNAPEDSRSREVASRHGVAHVHEPVGGLSRARNRGTRLCETEIVAYIDDDAIPDDQWLSRLVAEFDDPEVMAVAGRILPISTDTEAERLFERLGAFGSGPSRRVVDRQTPRWFEMTSFGGVGSGANMAVRRKAFDIWPGFDERLGVGTALPGYEEHYAFFSLVDRGHRVVYTPDAVVRHPYPRRMTELRARRFDSMVAASGFATLMFFEEPRYRRAILKYALEWLRGTPREWRNLDSMPPPSVISRWRMPFAWLKGSLTYFRTRGWPSAGGRTRMGPSR
jgi:cellulose synthase/poly-beta-1,6-N-acetylglucosamine synthase-like glycosyltransferase